MVLICVDLAIAVQDNVDDFGALAEVLLNRRKLVADSMYSSTVQCGESPSAQIIK
jgi:hypothetical protein